MADVGSMTVQFRGDMSHLIKTTEKLQKDLDRQNKNINSYLKKQESSFSVSMANIAKSVSVIGIAYAAAQASMKAFDIASKAIDIAANFEKFDAILRTIDGSSSKAQESMKWIQEFAASTPFNIEKVTSSFVSLKSYGLEPTDGLLRTLGDTSAAMGKDIQQAVEAMADAVTGENERLKEFGIRASVAGEEIKYSWTNSSGEMRQTVINNNAAMIESTLSAIFNSKYAGAMEEQSKTWNGLISNMEDNWTIFQKNLMDGGLFEYLKAIVTVVGEYMSEAFGNTLESSATFSKYVIEAIRSMIISMGSVYDSLETLGDYFSLVGSVAEVAFYGIQTISSTVARGMWQSFEGVLNYIIDSFNAIIELVNSTGLFEFGFIGKVDFDVAALQAREDYVYQQLERAKQELSGSWDDLMDTGAGAAFTENLVAKIDEAYAKIQETPTISAQKIDFGDTVEMKDVNSELTNYTVNMDNVANVNADVSNSVNDAVSNVTESFTDLSDTLYSDSGNDDVYTYVNNINDSFNDLNDTASSTVDAISEIADALEVFIFAFSDTFLNSIKTNISALTSVGTSSSFNALSYDDALFNANTKRDALIANPLDVNIGAQYKEAYDLFIDSASEYLGNMNNFNSAQDYAFAQATIGSQASTFEDTAMQTVDVLESMNSFLETINQAFADGILSDEEKATIAGVADVVNAKNDILLGSSSVMVAGINGIPTSIEAQQYFDNSLLAKEGTLSGGLKTTEQKPLRDYATNTKIGTTTYFDNTGLATDSKLASIKYYDNTGLATNLVIGSQEYYNNTGLATNANMNAQTYYNNYGLATDYTLVNGVRVANQLTDYATNAKIGSQVYYNNTGLATTVSTNSIKDSVAKLMGTGASGISLTSISGALPTLSVNTGLNVSDLSTIKTNTQSTNTSIGSVYNALGGASTSGVGLDNLKVNNVRVSYTGYTTTYNGQSSFHPGTAADNAGSTTSYQYYAKGGFTGSGMGEIDVTGQRQAGIVHEDEWVAPAWMIRKNPSLFGALEMARLGKNSNLGMASSASAANITVTKQESNTDKYLFVLADEMKKMNSLLRRVTENGEAMKTEVIK